MDVSSQSKPNFFTSNPNFKLKNIAIPLFMLLAGLLIGYSANRFLPSSTKMIAETDLPVGLAILKNPMINQWSGGVEGSLLRKDEKSLTLSKNGHTITIPVDQGTYFVNPIASSSASNKRVSLKDIPIGSFLRGAFVTTPQPRNKNIIYGSHFFVEKTP